MSQIEWAMWANEQAIATSGILLLGGVLGIAGMFNLWQFGIAALIIAILVAVLEWPRSKRKKGNTVLRQFQRPFAHLVNMLGFVGKNYFIRFVTYLVLCVPCCFTLCTLTGGICLLLTGVIYLVAAIKGEEWAPAGLEDPKKAANEKQVKSLEPPKKPPPRPGQAGRRSSSDEVQTEDVTMELMDEGPGTSQNKSGQPRTSPNSGGRPTRPPPRPKQPNV